MNQKASPVELRRKLIRNRLVTKISLYLLLAAFGLCISVPGIVELTNDLMSNNGIPFFGLLGFAVGIGFAIYAWEEERRKLDWLRGRIKSLNKSQLIQWWYITAVFLLVSLVSALVVFQDLNKGKNFPYWILIGPAIGLCALIATIYHSLRCRKFGESFFNMSPLLIDDHLKGTIETSVQLPDTSFVLKLSCVNRITTGYGRNYSVENRVLWKRVMRDVRQVPGVDETYSLIQVRIPVPDRLPESNESKSRDQIIWRFEISTELPGIDYFAEFEIPIFRRDQAPVVPKKSRRSRQKRR